MNYATGVVKFKYYGLPLKPSSFHLFCDHSEKVSSNLLFGLCKQIVKKNFFRKEKKWKCRYEWTQLSFFLSYKINCGAKWKVPMAKDIIQMRVLLKRKAVSFSHLLTSFNWSLIFYGKLKKLTVDWRVEERFSSLKGFQTSDRLAACIKILNFMLVCGFWRPRQSAPEKDSLVDSAAHKDDAAVKL